MGPAANRAIRYLATCAALAAMALALSACGEEKPAHPKKSAAGTSAQVIAPTGRAAAAAAAACRAQLGGFLADMDRLRGRLATGLSYQQYRAAVKGVRATYVALPIDLLPPDCLVAAGTPGERAFNRYIEAANAWGECLADAGCDAGVVEPRLQHEWSIASHFLSQAQAGAKG